MFPPRDTSEGLGSPQQAGVGVCVPHALEMKMPLGVLSCGPISPGCGHLTAATGELWNFALNLNLRYSGTYFPNVPDKDSAFPVLETISSCVLCHVYKCWSEFEMQAVRNRKSKSKQK